MSPLRLYLKGFKGIFAGLRKDAITLDLTVIPESARLIALVAENGVGKSTILDNLHPYRIMPGRAKGGLKPTAFSYWNEIAGPVAEKRLDWEHNGLIYRSNLMFKLSGKSQEQTAYLLWLNGENWEPVRIADGTLSDGSVGSYDRCVDAILGACEVFVTTAFASAKRTMLAEYATSDIKKLLSVWLNIAGMLKHSEDAAKVVSILQNSLNDCHEKLRDADTFHATLKDSNALRSTLKARIDAQVTNVHHAEQAAELARQAIVRLETQTESMRHFDLQRGDYRRQVEAERRRCGEAKRDIRQQLDVALQGYRQQHADLDRTVVKARSELVAQQAQLSALLKRIGSENDVVAAGARLKVLQQRQAELVVELEAIGKQADKLKPQRQVLVMQSGVQGKARTKGTAARERVDQITNVATLIERVPCAKTQLQAECELLKEARDAKGQLEAVRAELMTYRAQYRDSTRLLEAAGIDVRALEALEAKEGALRRESDAVGKEITSLTVTAALAQIVTEAKQQQPALQAAMLEKQKWIDDAVASQTACAAAMVKLTAETEQKINSASEASTRIIADIEARLAALPAEIEEKTRSSAIEARDKADQALNVARQDLVTLRGQLTEAELQVAQTQVRLEQLEPNRWMAERLTTEIASWEQTSLAIGKNGLVAFEIDDAGPEISAHANDLLKECYEGKFVVRFETQRELKTGDVREGFDIRVTDTQGGEEKSIEDLSGGEEVYVNECVTRAVALYLAESGRYQYATLFTDEADGRLDEVKKRRFIAMKRRVLEIGRYAREYFVTQSKDLHGMADYVIDVAAL